MRIVYAVSVCMRVVCMCMRARASVSGRLIALLNFFSDYIYKYYKYKRIHTRVKMDRR